MVLCWVVHICDRKVIFYTKDNKDQLTKDGIEYIVCARRMKTNISLVSANKMKRLVNKSKNFAFMKLKEKMLKKLIF